MKMSVYGDNREVPCPLPSTLESQVRVELSRLYYDLREAEFLQMLRVIWMDTPSACIHMSVLGSMVPTAAFLNPWNLARFCNKPTLLYWLPSARDQEEPYYPVYRECPMYIFTCIYKAWFRCQADDPDINFGQFFATPIKITSTGPQTLDGILEAHRTLCDQVTLLLEEVRSGTSGPTPSSLEKYSNYYNLLPLCRAVIVVLDEYVPPAEPEEEDGKCSLDRHVEEQSAVLVLTGDTSGLGHPLHFDAIRSESLPLVPSMEAAASGIETIRVPLKTAIHFIAESKRREDTTLSNPASRTYDKDPSTATSSIYVPFLGFERAEQWVENVMRSESAAPVPGTNIDLAMDRIRQRESGKAESPPAWSYWNHQWE